ncbi:MAG: M3 family oligoendopeptidase [Chitinophagales bacterium]|nr:M3 family oligoendopeptidase [Chitinophagales bacterium]MDW8419681.1 M3 family oligoendopeptidase [Chitinophagales bacterium]
MQLFVESDLPSAPKRTYLSQTFDPGNWGDIEPYLQELYSRTITDVNELHRWLHDFDELHKVISEHFRRIYVRTTINTADKEASDQLVRLLTDVEPKMKQYEQQLNKKLIESPHLQQLDENIYGPYIRITRKSVEIFREENVPLLSNMQVMQKEYNKITGAQTINIDGKDVTLTEAQLSLKSPDRSHRETIYRAMLERRLQDKKALDDLLTELIRLRHRVAVQAGYPNYVAYKFEELGRFDYSKSDCEKFHEEIGEIVLPVVEKFARERKDKLGVEKLMPWDAEVDISGKPPLCPARSADELINKAITCLNRLDPYFGKCIAIMHKTGSLDIEARVNKSNGGYNMGMPETGIPFIFMNAAKGEHDLITIIHEGGHAIHSFLTNSLPLSILRDVSAEMAELASMGMELLTIKHWDVFYENPDDLKRAQSNHLKYIIHLLARISLGDKFQYWLYENPEHTVEERRAKWVELHKQYSSSLYQWSEVPEALETSYQRILHFYIVPLYYVEYAFAQLGAIALWKNYMHNPSETVAAYKHALSLGYTRTIPDLYKAAGITFNFEKDYIRSQIEFLLQEYEKFSA